jgi:VCBS repeat-containing protein
VTITAINKGLVAGADVYATNEDTPLTVAAPGVLGNDGDEDDSMSLEASLLSGPSHGTLSLAADGSFTYTPAAEFSGVDGFTYRPAAGSSVIGSVTITVVAVNDQPTVTGLPTQPVVMDRNLTSQRVNFTVADAEGAAALVLTGSSSNTALVPNAAITFSGTGSARTVTVTPVAGASGSATITIRATDADGLFGQGTFVFTVNPIVSTSFSFVNVKNAPPPSGTRFKAGSAIPMQWRYASGATTVDSSTLTFGVTITGPFPNVTARNTDTGSSNFRYQASTKTWVFNMQTKETDGATLPVGTYTVTILPSDGRYATQSFTVALVK